MIKMKSPKALLSIRFRPFLLSFCCKSQDKYTYGYFNRYPDSILSNYFLLIFTTFPKGLVFNVKLWYVNLNKLKRRNQGNRTIKDLTTED
jgi:hypothetical protein